VPAKARRNASEGRKEGAVVGLPFNDVDTDTFFVELSDTGLGNFRNNGNLARNRPLAQMALLDKRLEVLFEFPGPYHMAITHHQQGKRALSPLRVSNPHHRYFAYRRVAADQVFEGQGGDPLAAGLDHILDAVANVDHAKGTARRPFVAH